MMDRDTGLLRELSKVEHEKFLVGKLKVAHHQKIVDLSDLIPEQKKRLEDNQQPVVRQKDHRSKLGKICTNFRKNKAEDPEEIQARKEKTNLNKENRRLKKNMALETRENGHKARINAMKEARRKKRAK